MANFILVSPSSGSGNVVIKVKPVNENTSTTVEKKGKLIIRVNGEIQKTIPLTQNIKVSSGGGGGEGGGTTTTKTLTSREISLDIYSGFYPDPSGLKCLNTNAEGGTKYNEWYLRPSYTYDSTSKDDIISIPYSVSAKQTDYFSDGTKEYTNLLPKFTWNDKEDQSGTMRYWEYEYSGDLKATSEMDTEVEVQSNDTPPVLAGYFLSIKSKVGMEELFRYKINKVYASFEVVSKRRTDVADTLSPSVIQVDIYWTITVLANMGLKPEPDFNKPIQ